MSTKNDIDNIYRQIKFYMILSEYEKYGLKYYRFRSMAGACDECTKRSEIIFFASEALNNRHYFDSHPNCKCVVELINKDGEVLLTLDADGNVKKSVLDSISELLTYASIVPGIDTFADLAAIPVDLLRGDFVSTGLDLIGAVPIVGEVADTAKIAKTVDKAVDARKMVNKATDFSKFTKNIHSGRQGKHIVGHNNYKNGRSIFSGSLSDAQQLIKKYSGTGQRLNANTERVNFKKVIGKYVDEVTGKSYDTTVGTIRYSKDGAHIVPARPINWRK